ncbi:MAG: cupredoxin domain-containing protein [Dehalococcoidia bacterium]|nr:cupredoxin domain-containing protein [Dehalococcoidia bacterium]
MSRLLPLALSIAMLVPMLSACGGESGSRRIIQIIQADDGCTPAAIDLKTGEAVTFEVRNDGKKDREVEGIDGTRLDEVLVPSGRTRKVNYDAPSKAGTAKIKCYIPAGNTTIIELNVTGKAVQDGGTTPAKDDNNSGAKNRKTDKTAQDTVTVALDSFTIKTDKPTAVAGPIKFVATNENKTDVHELAVLRYGESGGFENTGEIEDIDPGKGGEITLDLPPGKYQLACLIAAGEAGSTKDHYTEGMHMEFEVK